ncbi:hypothetical protein PF003_g31632 [Phytophthora fragariae]|nr:hypothetical protein PF003_g31632 [Phytophthora fragariae]
MAVLPVPVLVASLMCCCRCQLPASSVAARASCRFGQLQHVPVAGVMPVLVAGLVLCCRCQLPAWSVAARANCRHKAGASCRLGL